MSEALATHIVEWMMQQKYGGEDILHAVVCCDHVSHMRFVAALAQHIQKSPVIAAKEAEIERLKGDNARFQSAHDGLLAEIDKLAKHDMAVGTALREMRDALRKCDESSASRSGGPCDCGACRNARAVLAKYAPLAGEANHA